MRVKFKLPWDEYVLKLERKGQDPETGGEVPDPTPMAPAVGFVQQDSMVMRVRSMVASELLRQRAEAEGFDTFEEADDFDVGDDFDPETPYEAEFEPVAEVISRAATERPGAEGAGQGEALSSSPSPQVDPEAPASPAASEPPKPSRK